MRALGLFLGLCRPTGATGGGGEPPTSGIGVMAIGTTFEVD